ncbi:carbon-nitrogen hydrolase family protein [Risungbinella massiliensis]|uniref:carbon-nitrogen hydrolase family protein n=1 Tax=Risungbinella massiliensis TaxID=1329796 RepID=UPI0005CC3C3A|nr:carbon-nitrogen hydrolase family protein [Risungbinella massiliensis]
MYKVATTQYELQPLLSIEEFWHNIEVDIQEAAHSEADLIVFPEYLTAHLLALEPLMTHEQACQYLNSFTEQYLTFFTEKSKQYQLMILAGTHIHHMAGKGFINEAFLFFPDGTFRTQPKVHLTPEEQKLWKLAPGEEVEVIDTPIGRVAILTCYDIEFPELSRIVTDLGAELILCPSYTDTIAGYYRVRHCAQARAIENQRFVVLSGIVGELPHIPQIDTGYCRAGVFSPCDHPFPADGVIAIGEGEENRLVIAELQMDELRQNWELGQVAPFRDRKPELYDRLRVKAKPNS